MGARGRRSRSWSRSSRTIPRSGSSLEDGKLVGMEFELVTLAQGTRNRDASRRTVHDTEFLRVRRRHPRHRPGQRLPLDRARHRHRVQPLGHARSSTSTTFMTTVRGDLRGRRRGVGTGEHHLGGGARPSGRHLDPQLLPGAVRLPTDRPPQDHEPHQPAKMGMHEWAYSNDYNRGAAPEDEPRGAAVRRFERARPSKWRMGFDIGADRAPRWSAASTATSRPTSRRSCASNATPASTSARCTASRSRVNGPDEEDLTHPSHGARG